jgi:hypothetical protein
MKMRAEELKEFAARLRTEGHLVGFKKAAKRLEELAETLSLEVRVSCPDYSMTCFGTGVGMNKSIPTCECRKIFESFGE